MCDSEIEVSQTLEITRKCVQTHIIVENFDVKEGSTGMHVATLSALVCDRAYDWFLNF